MDHLVLEPAARAVADATANPPFSFEVGVERARANLSERQAGPVDTVEVGVDKWITVAAEVGDVKVRILKPVGAAGTLPVILYLHGGGWVLGDSRTHDRLIRELAVGANAALAFVEYDRSPEVRYPVAIEQAYATARWITDKGSEEGLDGTRMAVVGDSAGGNMAAALAILAKRRGDVRFVHQSLYYPATDAAQDTESYRTFADGPYLRAKGMAWFWDSYLPDVARRSEITASPLRATLEDLAGLPPALVITAQNDVLRDEGEAFAAKLTEAGVKTTSVRYNLITHDFMMLNREREAQAAGAAIETAIRALRNALGTAGPAAQSA